MLARLKTNVFIENGGIAAGSMIEVEHQGEIFLRLYNRSMPIYWSKKYNVGLTPMQLEFDLEDNTNAF